MSRILNVYLNEHPVGDLIQEDTGEITFQYDIAWISAPSAMPLSQSLPLRSERFSARECTGFFGGILPEGENREIIAKNLGITARNDVKMLEMIGGECAGAITFLRPGESLAAQGNAYRLLQEDELAEILRELPHRPLLAGEEHIRLSLAGAQNKLAVHVALGNICLPLDGAPSTHILKPAISRFPGMVDNELFCMRLAGEMGLHVPPVRKGGVEGIEYLLVARYDRIPQDSSLKRLHQEDFCQALGIISANKYQNEGGPSLKQCFDLVRRVSYIPAQDLPRLLDAVIFNFLIGNNDAHGKNFSLLYGEDGEESGSVFLAPLYDLICTMYYPGLSSKMAMKIGGEYEPGRVAPHHFERLAEECSMGKSTVRRRVDLMAKKMRSYLTGKQYPNPVEREIADIVRLRCDATVDMFQQNGD